jgi:hypothetical protein
VTTIEVNVPERMMLRDAHRVREIEATEEGTGITQLPAGVYGFTHAPGSENAPLFRTPTRHSFEVHRLTNGSVLLAYVSREAGAVLEHAPEDFSITVFPYSSDKSPVLVAIEWSRLHLIKRYATPNKDGGIDLKIIGRE